MGFFCSNFNCAVLGYRFMYFFYLLLHTSASVGDTHTVNEKNKNRHTMTRYPNKIVKQKFFDHFKSWETFLFTSKLHAANDERALRWVGNENYRQKWPTVILSVLTSVLRVVQLHRHDWTCIITLKHSSEFIIRIQIKSEMEMSLASCIWKMT